MSDKEMNFVLGGGPTGLATAVKLARAGVPTTLVERLPWVGGLSKTFEHGPYKLDLGPHRFTPHNQEVFDFVDKLLPGELQQTAYKAQIWMANRFVGYPFRLKELLTRIPPRLSVRFLSTFLGSLFKSSDGMEKTYEEWILHHFGSAITENIFRPLVEKVWGTPLSQLSERFARQRIATSSLWEIAVEVLTGKRNQKFHSPFYPDNGFLYPMNGFGTIIDRMAEDFQKNGGRILTSATAREIRIENGRVQSVAYEKDGQTIIEPCDFLHTTIPIQYFFESIRPAAPPSVLATAQKLKTRRLILLYLVLDMDRYSDNTSLYFPSPEFPYGRAWEQKNHSVKTVDVPGKTVLGLEIPCWEDDDSWKADDKSIMEMAVAPLVKHRLLDRSKILEFFTVRLGWVYPVWDLDFEKNLGVLLEYEGGIENLIMNGRPGLYFYNNLHHSLDMGFVGANHVLSGLPKSRKWDVDSKKFKSFTLVE